MVKLVWMSDLHFLPDGGVLGLDPRARLEAAIDHINTHHDDADFCVISGDIAETATAATYREARVVLDRLAMPYLPIVGNHDARDLMRAHLPVPDGAMQDFVQYAVETAAGRLICLDTLKDAADSGEFCVRRMNWLQGQLEAAGPVYVFMHHPPMALGLPMQDPDNLVDGDVFLDLIEASDAVRYLFLGHVHRPISGVVRGIPFSTMRSVLYQAPAPRPAWDWDTFAPADEAPNIGIVTISDGAVTLHYEQV